MKKKVGEEAVKRLEVWTGVKWWDGDKIGSMRKCSAVILLLLPLVVEQSTPTSDLEVSLVDSEVSSGDSSAASERRLRASSSYNEDSQPKHVLPINKQVSAFLPGNRYKRFLYRESREEVATSLVVTPCSAALIGRITFHPDNIGEGGKRELLKIQGPDQVIYSIRRERPGNYDINITAVADTYVHFLATDEDLSGLGSLRTEVRKKNWNESRAEISWTPGSYGNQSLRYCLITSPTRHFSSMCGGLSAKFGQQPPDGGGGRRRRQKTSPPLPRRRPVQNGNITVGCVGKATVYTLYDLVPERLYYVTVFGQYVNRSISFQYGTMTFQYRDRSERTTLRVRQKQVSHQRLSPARPFRRFELRGPLRSEKLYYFVRSCGGPVSVRTSAKYVSAGHPHQPSPIQEAKNVESGVLFRGIIEDIRLATRDDRYQFDLVAAGDATVVEFQATTRRRQLRVVPLPDRPDVHAVREKRRRRLGLSCTQLALRMRKARGRRQEYCVLLEPDTSGRADKRFKRPSACGLEARVNHSPDSMKRCGTAKELRRGKQIVVIFDDLTPGQTYLVRAMVKPHKGQYVPYNLSQVTLPPCSDELTNELTESNIGGLEPISGPGSSGRQVSAAGGGRFEQGKGQWLGAGAREDQAHAEAMEETFNKVKDWTP